MERNVRDTLVVEGMDGLSKMRVLKNSRTTLAGLQRDRMHGLRDADVARHRRLVRRRIAEGRELGLLIWPSRAFGRTKDVGGRGCEGGRGRRELVH